MKKKLILAIVLGVMLLTGCVVKSLKPFYTKATLSYDASITGVWQDNDSLIWKVRSMQTEMGKGGDMVESKHKEMLKRRIENKAKQVYKNAQDIKVKSNLTLFDEKSSFEEELEEIYAQGYWVEIPDKKGKMMQFVAIPFKIKGQLFLDFTPFDVGIENISNFAEMHYVGVHTLAKVDKVGEALHISWLSESRIEELFEQKKIRISHEKVGVDKSSYLLTASSEELQKFIAKYMSSEAAEKWETNVKFVLKRVE